MTIYWAPTDEDRECLDVHKGDCSGEVQFHPSLAGTGTMIPRCTKHYEDHVMRDEERRQIYPDSPFAPSWFDPEAAGERWDDDY